MTRYKLTGQAKCDVDDIVQYIALESSVDRAIDVYHKFREAFRTLGDMPGMGHFREDLLSGRYKFWSVYSYVIVYEWDVSPIRIIGVVHGARDLGAFLIGRLNWNRAADWGRAQYRWSWMFSECALILREYTQDEVIPSP